MELLEKKILTDGRIIGNDILKVDSFINHQIDINLLNEIGKYFSSKFTGFNKILTIEASGIAFAVGVSYNSNMVPVVFAKKSLSKIVDENNIYSAKVESFTKKVTNTICVDKRFLSKDDKILIVDDFLATGSATLGLIDLCKQAGAEVIGVATVIEKGFQGGRKKIEDLGIQVESGAIIKSFENGKPIF